MENDTQKNTPKQNAFNFASTFIFLVMLVATGYYMEKQGIDITDITVKEIAILILAIFRLTRIVVFEKIFKFLRDIVKSKDKIAIFRTLKTLMTCPWCSGVWMSLVVFVVYYLVPYGKLFVYILSISGLASLVVLFSNLLFLHVDEKQYNRGKR